jgi:hypothetical protein
MRAPIVKIKSLAGTYQGDEGSCIGQNELKSELRRCRRNAGKNCSGKTTSAAKAMVDLIKANIERFNQKIL